MAALGRKYSKVCNDPDKTDIVQPYIWLGIISSSARDEKRYSIGIKMEPKIMNQGKNFTKHSLNTYELFLATKRMEQIEIAETGDT